MGPCLVSFSIFLVSFFSVGEEKRRRKGRRGRERERELGKEEIYERVFASDFNECVHHFQNPNFWSDGEMIRRRIKALLGNWPMGLYRAQSFSEHN